MHKPQIIIFSEVHENPATLAEIMADRINGWMAEKDLRYDDIEHFTSNMNAGQDGENNNALWYCYTATIVHTGIMD